MNQNQPTRTPPTEPGDYRQSLIDLRDELERKAKRLDELIAKLEPFAPQLPVVELWGSGEYIVVVYGDEARVHNEGDCFWVGLYSELKRVLPTAKRTHVCKWEPCDE